MKTGNLPEHLNSYDNLIQHIRGELEGLPTKQKGDKFEHFVRGIVRETDIGAMFDEPIVHGGSGDGGVDLIASQNDSQSRLYIQSKLYIDRTEDIDQVLRKFSDYYAEQHHAVDSHGQFKLEFQSEPESVHFMVVTLSRLNSLLKRYETRSLSEDFYRQWKSKGHLHFIDGEDILSILRADFLRRHESPAEIELQLEATPIKMGNVYLSIVSSETLRRLYNKFGNALFFENVRDFLGMANEDKASRTSPNKEMVKTITTSPAKMLERNNGVVFKASRVEVGSKENILTLIEGSIVNGCQTTTCIVENAKAPCHVVAKIVQATEPENQWEIAEAANYQNKISYLDLQLARAIRPQLVERAAAVARVRLDRSERTAFQLMDDMYRRRVAYDEIRLLYIGLFSKKPNNVISSNYTELDSHLISSFYDEDPRGQGVFDALFILQQVAQEGLEAAEGTFSNSHYDTIFGRFYKQGSQYRCFVALLALCATFDMTLEDDSVGPEERFRHRKSLVSLMNNELEKRSVDYVFYYKLAVKVWMDAVSGGDEDEDSIRRNMNTRTKQVSFTNLLRKLRTDSDFHRSLQKSNPT